MANRNPSTALIRGEAVARRNFDNTPGMYAGMDKLSKAGSDLMKGVDDQNKELKLEIQRIQTINKKLDFAQSEVLKRYGGLATTVDREASKNRLLKGRKLLLSGNDDEANKIFSGESEYIDRLLDVRLKIANNMSSATNPAEKEKLEVFLKEDYTRDDSGPEPVYTSTREGVEFSMTLTEVEDMFVEIVPQYSEAYRKVLGDEYNTRKLNKKIVLDRINRSIPKLGNVKHLRAFLSDEIMSNQNFEAMLDADEGLEAEVNAALLENSRFNFDEDENSISPDEFAMFKKAIVDPFAKDGNGNLFFSDTSEWEKFVRPIVVEKLYQGIENENRILYPDNYKVEEVDLEGENKGEFDNLINQN